MYISSSSLRKYWVFEISYKTQPTPHSVKLHSHQGRYGTVMHSCHSVGWWRHGDVQERFGFRGLAGQLYYLNILVRSLRDNILEKRV